MMTFKYTLEDASEAELAAARSVGLPEGCIGNDLWYKVPDEVAANEIADQLRAVAPKVTMVRDVDGFPGRKELIV